MIQLSLWSVVNWLGRTAQWLGGFYLLLAAIAALRESNQPLLPSEEKSRPALYRDAMAVAMVLAAAAVRLAFLSALGTHAPFVVFYPAVIFAALYGGRRRACWRRPCRRYWPITSGLSRWASWL